MATVEVDGVRIAYEVLGHRGRPWVLTPGGRFSKDAPGVRELAGALAEGGQTVVIWDRPNTGASDVCFTGPSESEMQADQLSGLLGALDLGPTVIVGGSGGARVSLLAAARHPRRAAKLALWWISGGVYGLMVLATVYCGESIRVAWQHGMEAVVELPEWAEVLERNPGNRQRFLALDRRVFIATLERWMAAYCPVPGSVVPGVTDAELGRLDVPSLVFRSAERDPYHTRATSERLCDLLAHSTLVEPPWGDDEWVLRSDAARRGEGHLFERWPLLAPQLLDFAG
ncbi:MAG: alpha/beta fold hydrolase [Acidimicrobiales bacterium]